MNGNRYCYHADESFQRESDGLFLLVRIVENEAGYTPVMTFTTLDEARVQANSFNGMNGLTDEDVLTIRTTSMAAHNTQKRSDA